MDFMWIFHVLFFVLTQTDLVFSRGQSFFLNPQAFSPQEKSATTGALLNAAENVCTNTGIGITFRQNVMMNLGIGVNQLTLADENCKALSNGTHYTLTTEFAECLTNMNRTTGLNGVITFSNKVILSPPDFPALRTLLATENSAEKDVDERDSQIHIKFTCIYQVEESKSQTPTAKPTARQEIPKVSQATQPTAEVTPLPHHVTLLSNQLSMELFSTDSYMESLDLSRNTVTKGTSLYAKISIIDGMLKRNTNVFIKSCYLRDVTKSQSHPHYLIQDGCPKERDVAFKQDTAPYLGDRRFIFRAMRPFKNRPLRLSCDVIPCYGDDCTKQEDFCNTNYIDSSHPVTVSYDYDFIVDKRKRNKHHQQLLQPNDPQTTEIPDNTPPQNQPLWIQPEKKPTSQALNCPPVVQQPVICKCPAVDKYTKSVPENDGVTVSIEVTIAISVGMFFLGVVLVAILWIIHMKTNPRHKMKAVSISDDALSSQSSGHAVTAKLMPHSDLAGCSLQST